MWGFAIEKSFGDSFAERGLFFASVIRLLINPLLMILVWSCHPEICLVGVSLGGVEVGFEITLGMAPGVDSWSIIHGGCEHVDQFVCSGDYPGEAVCCFIPCS